MSAKNWLQAIFMLAAIIIFSLLVPPQTFDPWYDQWAGRTLTANLCGPYGEGNFKVGPDVFCKPGKPLSIRVQRLVTADVYRGIVLADGHRPDDMECRPGTILHLRPAFLMVMLDFSEPKRVAKSMAAAEHLDPLRNPL